MFSLPFISICVSIITFKQNPAHQPINFPPKITTVWGKNNEGKNIIDIKIIPPKKNILNIKFLNIIFNVTLIQKAFVFC